MYALPWVCSASPAGPVGEGERKGGERQETDDKTETEASTPTGAPRARIRAEVTAATPSTELMRGTENAARQSFVGTSPKGTIT
jgi:hypothetical protein